MHTCERALFPLLISLKYRQGSFIYSANKKQAKRNIFHTFTLFLTMRISLNYISTNRRGLLCCLGGFLLCLAQSLDYSYPNLNTYITSYMRKNGLDYSRKNSVKSP